MKSELEELKTPLHLIVQYYRCASAERQAEIDTCLRNNLLNPYLTAIHLLTEKLFDLSRFPNNEKIIQVVIGERLSFERAFQYANETDREGQRVWILSNADIYFDESLQCLLNVKMDNVVFALTRHNVQDDGTIKIVDAAFAHGCQDAWIFKSPLALDKIVADFSLGIPGCDNRIAHEFIAAGYKVINPALKICARHLDLTRDTNIYERDKAYAEMMSSVVFSEGKAAPPPYQYHLYPVDQLDPDSLLMYRSYMQNMTELGRRIIQQEAEKLDKSQQIEELGYLLDEAYKQIARQSLQADEHGRLIGKLYQEIIEQRMQVENSLSWRITKPLRYLNSLIRQR